jgi:putative ABC transport system permease protein
MLRNYFLVALRNILKQRFYSVINIVGLTVGIIVTLFILLYVQDELSYDQFHQHIDQMYRVGLNGKLEGQEIHAAVTPPPLAEAMTNEVPGVTEAVRLWRWEDVVVKYEDNAFTEDQIFHTDSNFFRVFSFELLKGDPETALREPNSMVVTESIARKLFGQNEALGKIVIFSNDNKAMKVTGVVQDAPPNSHFRFNYLISFSSNEFGNTDQWLSNSLQTYFLLEQGADADAVMATLNEEIIPKYVGPQIQQFLGISLDQFESGDGEYGYFVDPVKEIHLYSDAAFEFEPPGDIAYVYIFSIIGLFILSIASINFMNLSTARSAGRAREVGLRKTLGSQKWQLVSQFLLESLIYSVVAMVLAILFVWLLMPQFNQLAGKMISITQVLNPSMVFGTLVLTLMLSLLAGSYPAFYLTSFRITEVLKGSSSKGTKSASVRGILVVVQFAISILLIVCTITVQRQLQLTQTKNLGFDRNKVLVLSNADRLGNNRKAFKDALMSNANIVAASYSTSVIPGVNNTTVFRKPESEEDHMIGVYFADHEQVDVLGFEVVQGRNFSRDFPSDSTGMLVNETIVKEMGWENPIGEKLITFFGEEPTEITVIGVLKDFNFESLRDNIRPILIRLGNDGNDMMVRYSSENAAEAIEIVESTWRELVPDEPFQFTFLDERFDNMYRVEQRLGKLFTLFAGLAIFIACLGLFGLASFTAEQRTKEIGIRKVMGANSFSLVRLLSAEFIKFVAVAFLIAILPAYYAMTKWLESFVYRIDLSWQEFAFSGVLALVIAQLTVSFQSFKASQQDPVTSLRHE